MSTARPKQSADRISAYLAQTDRREMTPTQFRRDRKKWNRARRAEAGRVLTPRQSRWAGIRAARAARKAALR